MRFKTLNYLLVAYLVVATVFILYMPVTKQVDKWWRNYRVQGMVLGVGTHPAQDNDTQGIWVLRVEGMTQFMLSPANFDLQKGRMAQFRILPDHSIKFMHYLEPREGEQP
jgi:hypothetical protein